MYLSGKSWKTWLCASSGQREGSGSFHDAAVSLELLCSEGEAENLVWTDTLCGHTALTGGLPFSTVTLHELLALPLLVKLQKGFDSSPHLPGTPLFLFWPVCVG